MYDHYVCVVINAVQCKPQIISHDTSYCTLNVVVQVCIGNIPHLWRRNTNMHLDKIHPLAQGLAARVATAGGGAAARASVKLWHIDTLDASSYNC